MWAKIAVYKAPISAYPGLYGNAFLLEEFTIIIILLFELLSNPLPMHVAFILVYQRVQKVCEHGMTRIL